MATLVLHATAAPAPFIPPKLVRGPSHDRRRTGRFRKHWSTELPPLNLGLPMPRGRLVRVAPARGTGPPTDPARRPVPRASAPRERDGTAPPPGRSPWVLVSDPNPARSSPPGQCSPTRSLGSGG